MKTFALNVSYLTIASSVVLPLLTGFVTKLDADRRVKALVLLVLSVAGGLAQTLIAKHGVVTWTSVTDNSIATYVLAAVMHTSLLKPTGVTDAVQGAAPNFGLGSATASVGSDDVEPATASAGGAVDLTELADLVARLERKT